MKLHLPMALLLGTLATAPAAPWAQQMQTRSPGTPPPQQAFRPYGRVVAVTIGINQYKALDPLAKPETDARAVAELFREQYGYEVLPPMLGTQATREGILKRLQATADTLSSDDVMIVYWGGHGETVVEQATPHPAEHGFLVPSDADVRRGDHFEAWRKSAIDMDELSLLARQTKARHVLFLIDSCHSGHLGVRSGVAGMGHERILIQASSRFAITAGMKSQLALETDAGGIFGTELLKLLRRTDPLGVRELHWRLQKAVGESSAKLDQDPKNARLCGNGKCVMTPMLKPIGDHEGEFFFIPKVAARSPLLAQLTQSLEAFIRLRGQTTGRAELYDTVFAAIWTSHYRYSRYAVQRGEIDLLGRLGNLKMSCFFEPHNRLKKTSQALA